MKNLRELMDECLVRITSKFGFSKLEEFINQDKLSAKFISILSEGFEFAMPPESSAVYSIAQSRARHSAITFLLGMVFEKFGNLMEEIGKTFLTGDTDLQYALWMLTSLNHDRAYTSERLNDYDLDYSKVFRNVLLREYYEDSDRLKLSLFPTMYKQAMTYTYDEILNYDQYVREFHKKRGDIEKVDHGILGGHMLFDELIRRYEKAGSMSDFEWLQARCCSMTIAQHNIFKASKSCDHIYKEYSLDRLLSDSELRISMDTPLLLLLSLVDTVECVKRFSKSENGDKYLQTLTVLESIQAEVTKESITLDFSALRNEIKKKGDSSLEEELNKHIKALRSIGSWTELHTEGSKDKVLIKVARAKEDGIRVAS